jgi:hypothetical protein
MIAEVPETFSDAAALFDACGYVQEALLTDYLLQREDNDGREPANERERGSHASGAGNRGPALRQAQGVVSLSNHASEPVEGSGGAKPPGPNEGFVIPVTVDDLAANGLLGEDRPQTCWARSVETLMARKDEITGIAVASDERIEAYVLCLHGGEIISLRSFAEDGGARLKQLLSRLRAPGMGTFRLPKVHPAEISKQYLETLGFRPTGGHRLCAARARGD